MADAPARPNRAWLGFWQNLPLRLVAYYSLIAGVVAAVTPFLPRDTSGRVAGPVGRLIGGSADVDQALVGAGRGSAAAAMAAPGGLTEVAASTLIAISAAVLFTLPVAWVYMFARKKKGYQQALVQSLLILPVVVTGIVILVQHSLALAFGLGAIVAAVRFRTNIEDSKDAAFIFAAMAIGLACGVELPVAALLSACFNAVMIALWVTDFGASPANLEGDLARRRLDRALAIANRTGAFIARMDEEVLKSLAPEQLEALATRARRRREKLVGEPATTGERPPSPNLVVRVLTRDPEAARPLVEPVLHGHLAEWRYLRALPAGADGVAALEYAGRLSDATIPQQVLYDVRTRGAPHVIRCELEPRGSGDDA